MELYRTTQGNTLKICSFEDIRWNRLDGRTLELLPDTKEQTTKLDAMRPSFGGGVDFAQIYCNGKMILTIKAKAPFSSYPDHSYPVQSPRFQDFKSHNGQLFDGQRFKMVYEDTVVGQLIHDHFRKENLP